MYNLCDGSILLNDKPFLIHMAQVQFELMKEKRYTKFNRNLLRSLVRRNT